MVLLASIRAIYQPPAKQAAIKLSTGTSEIPALTVIPWYAKIAIVRCPMPSTITHSTPRCSRYCGNNPGGGTQRASHPSPENM